MTTIVPCPTCRIPVEWCGENAYRPFCSERCQLIDLGEWAQEKRIISTQLETLEEWDALHHE